MDFVSLAQIKILCTCIIQSRMRKFDSGVLVVQSLCHSEEVIIKSTATLVGDWCLCDWCI